MVQIKNKSLTVHKHEYIRKFMKGSCVYHHGRVFDPEERAARHVSGVINDIEIRIFPVRQEAKEIALVDTASEYTIIPPEVADDMVEQGLDRLALETT
jgi:hypothetical protein